MAISDIFDATWADVKPGDMLASGDECIALVVSSIADVRSVVGDALKYIVRTVSESDDGRLLITVTFVNGEETLLVRPTDKITAKG